MRANRVQILEEVVCNLHDNTLKNGMNPTILDPTFN